MPIATAKNSRGTMHLPRHASAGISNSSASRIHVGRYYRIGAISKFPHSAISSRTRAFRTLHYTPSLSCSNLYSVLKAQRSHMYWTFSFHLVPWTGTALSYHNLAAVLGVEPTTSITWQTPYSLAVNEPMLVYSRYVCCG